jgi:peptidoglycan hydrolase-like protein with peptidoglycan-binding domain
LGAREITWVLNIGRDIVQKSWCVVGSLLLASQLACGADPGQGGDVSGDPAGAVALGASGPEVVSLREYLTQYGYFPNETLRAAYPHWNPMLPAPTGDRARFDVDLQSAVTKFQRNMGLAPSGVLDAATAQAMAEPRCGFPDDDPDATGQGDKWALISGANRWTKTAIKYRINQPNVVLQGMGTKEATKAAILAGFRLWQATTNLTFTEVSSGEDLIVDYMNLGSPWASGNAPPFANMLINSTKMWTPFLLVMAVGHEAGHVLGLHHSSNFVTNVTSIPLMSPSGNSNAAFTNDDKVSSNALYNDWELLPGLAFDIGAGVNGAVWIIGTGAREPFRWNGSNWEVVSLGQPCSRIDVDASNRPWVVTAGNRIFRHDGVSWREVPGGGRALDIGIGREGNVFVVGTDRRIYKHVSNAWSLWGTGANVASIDVDMAGIPHVVDTSNRFWVCPNNCATEAGGMGLDIGYGGPSFFTFGTENWGWAIGLSDTIWARNRQAAIPNPNPGSVAPAADTWVQTSGAARRITVGPNGRPWIVTSAGNIFRRLELP